MKQELADAMRAGTVTITGHGGDEIEAYLADPLTDEPRGSVVVIHHMPGFDEATKEVARRVATWGLTALCPNLHHREAPGAQPDDAAAACRASGGVPDERLVGDVDGAAAYLRSRPTTNGAVGAIGFCSGGRQALLAACFVDLQAVVDCYGAFVLAPPPSEMRLNVEPIEGQLSRLRAPVLGLFGNEDANPSPVEVDRLDELLTSLGKEHEFHRFDGAGHSFFAVDRGAYRPEVATAAWQVVRRFLARELSPQEK